MNIDPKNMFAGFRFIEVRDLLRYMNTHNFSYHRVAMRLRVPEAKAKKLVA